MGIAYPNVEVKNVMMDKPKVMEFVACIPGHRDATVEEIKRYWRVDKVDVNSKVYRRIAAATGYHRYVLKDGVDFFVIPMNGSHTIRLLDKLGPREEGGTKQ